MEKVKKPGQNKNRQSKTPSKNRLGRGLDLLLGPSESPSLLLDIEKVFPNPDQPRKAFNKESLQELAQSINQNGLLQAILVKKSDKGYQIIAGERRWRASALAGLKKIPALLKNPSAKQTRLWALVENLQREDLNPIEQAQSFKKIMKEHAWSQEELAQHLDRSRPSIANTLRLLNLDPTVQALVRDKKLSFSQARELLAIKEPLRQKKLAQSCLDKKLTVQKIKGKNQKTEKPFWLRKTLSQLEKKFQAPIKLQKQAKNKGFLSIAFKNESDLKRILDILY